MDRRDMIKALAGAAAAPLLPAAPAKGVLTLADLESAREMMTEFYEEFQMENFSFVVKIVMEGNRPFDAVDLEGCGRDPQGDGPGV